MKPSGMGIGMTVSACSGAAHGWHLTLDRYTNHLCPAVEGALDRGKGVPVTSLTRPHSAVSVPEPFLLRRLTCVNRVYRVHEGEGHEVRGTRYEG